MVKNRKTGSEFSDLSRMGISVTEQTKNPLMMIKVPVTEKGRQKPPASYMKAPMTGPRVSPKN